MVFRTAQRLGREDEEIAARIRDRMDQGAKCILIFNKTDLDSRTSREDLGRWCRTFLVRDDQSSDSSSAEPLIVSCSMKTGEGYAQLGETIASLFHTGEIAQNNEIFLTNLRHREAMQEALTSIQLVEESIAGGMSEEFYSVDLMNAYRALGTILGEAVEDDLVEEIFSRFCLGK